MSRPSLPRRIALLSVVLGTATCTTGEAATLADNAASMFRGGPARLGSYDASDGPALAGVQWRVMTDGDVISSPVVLGQTVYVGSGDGKLYALDRTSGATRWTHDAGNAIASSPAVGGGLVYFATRDGHVSAVDASSGARRWRIATGRDMPWPWGHESGDVYTSSPAYLNGTVVLGAGDGGVYALDARTGRQRWRAATGGRVRSSPAISDGSVFVGSADGRVYSFDLATGKERWHFDTEGVQLHSENFGYDRRTVQSSPAVSNGTVFVGARDGFIYAISADSGHMRWRFDHKISWVNTSPAVRDGIVYAGSSDAQFIQALDGATGKELWRTKTGTTWSSPAVTEHFVYAGDGAGHLTALDRATGAIRWQFRVASQVWSSPLPDGDLVFFGSTDGAIYALRTTTLPAVRRAVFFDTAYIKSSSLPDPALVTRFLGNRGYDTITAATLESFLRARIADHEPSVIVFAIDHLPPSITDSVPERSLFRQYLDAGGKVVWPGIPPLLFPRDPATGSAGGLSALNWRAATRLLGVSHDSAMFDQRGVRATESGRRWGLPDRWRGAWGIAIDPSITVLGRDEYGQAVSWVKRYGGPEGTGFVRIPGDDPLSVYLVAEYRPSGVSTRR